MKRTEIINLLIKKYGYTSYLEIGVRNKNDNFNEIKCERKVCIDPDPASGADYVMTSDEYFKLHNGREFFNIIFIDGLHENLQVQKDIWNSLMHMYDNGSIVLHDCNPQTKRAAKPWGELGLSESSKIKHEWNGDVYRAFIDFKHVCNKDVNLSCFVVDTDYGCGVIVDDSDLKIGKTSIDNFSLDPNKITFEQFNKQRTELLELISIEQFKTIFND